MRAAPEDVTVVQVESGWVHWPVYWSAVWVGALAAIATALIIGLAGVAVGAHQASREVVVSPGEMGLGALAFGVVGAFLAFVVGGWVAVKIAGIRRSEPAALHGAIVWLVGLPVLLALGALGAGEFLGNWFGGLIGVPAWATTTGEAVANPEAAEAARNAALLGVTAALLGLMGGVLGGWMASGQPMTVNARRSRRMVTARRTA